MLSGFFRPEHVPNKIIIIIPGFLFTPCIFRYICTYLFQNPCCSGDHSPWQMVGDPIKRHHTVLVIVETTGRATYRLLTRQ